MDSKTNQDRLRLREKNEAALNGENHVPAARLDSSLKKNMAFTKKLKTINAENYSAALKGIESLTLEKYISEVCISIEEAALKINKSDDIIPFVEVVSLLNQRFPGLVVPQLISALVNCVVNLDESEPITRARNSLRILFEMFLCGLAPTFSLCDKDSLSDRGKRFLIKFKDDVMILPLLRDLMSFRGSHTYALPAIVLFLKRYLFILDTDQDLVSEELQTSIKKIFTTYTEAMIDVLTKQHSVNASMKRKEKEVSIRTGRAPTDILQEENVRGYEEENLISAQVTFFCTTLNMEPPTFDDEEQAPETTTVVVADTTEAWWEDAKEKSFYKEVPTLTEVMEDLSIQGLPDEDISHLKDSEKVTVFLQRLEDVQSKLGVNVLVKAYMTQIPHNKATVNRLLRFFQPLPKIDSIIYYARYLCISSEAYPELISELVDKLDLSFRAQIHHGSIDLRSLYLFVELIKFDLIPTHVVFHKIRKMTMNIAGTNNADILLIFYERCGKFLILEPKYLETTKEMLQLLHDQSKSDKLSINEKLALRNMFLIVDSFTSKAVDTQKEVEKSPQQDFVQQLLRRLCVAGKHVEVARILNECIADPSVESAILEVYLRPEELPLDNLPSLAEVLRAIGTKNKFLVYRVCDTLEEQIVSGLELDDYRHNTARMAQIKLLAALSNQKVLAFRCSLQLMFKIICLGHDNNLPLPNSELAIDMPDNYFRILLVCMFLRSIKMARVARTNVFQTGAISVEGLLVFLQYYILCKEQPIPLDLQFQIEDAYRKYEAQTSKPFNRVSDIRSALLLLQKYTESSAASSSTQMEIVDLESEEELEWDGESSVSLSEAESEDDTNENPDVDVDAGSELELELDADSELLSSSDSDLTSYLELLDVLDSEAERDRQEELEALELERKQAQSIDDGIRELMKESDSDSRSAGPLKAAVPSLLLADSRSGSMNFSLLGRNDTLREVPLLLDGEFAERIKQEQDAQKANRAKILSLIDNMEA